MTRHNIAFWTGEAREALWLFKELLPDQVRVLGPDHPLGPPGGRAGAKIYFSGSGAPAPAGARP